MPNKFNLFLEKISSIYHNARIKINCQYKIFIIKYLIHLITILYSILYTASNFRGFYESGIDMVSFVDSFENIF